MTTLMSRVFVYGTTTKYLGRNPNSRPRLKFRLCWNFCALSKYSSKDFELDTDILGPCANQHVVPCAYFGTRYGTTVPVIETTDRLDRLKRLLSANTYLLPYLLTSALDPERVDVIRV